MRKVTISLILVLILTIAALPAAAAQYTDYATDIDKHWSKIYVEYLQRNNLVEGFPDGTFRPDQPVTRAEFAKMFITVANNEYCKANQLKTLVKPNFKVNQFKDGAKIPAWAASYIEYAVKYGYINGFDDNTFRPDQNITKVEAVKIIGSTLNREYDIDSLNYLDPIPEWAKPAVAKAHDYGLIEMKKDGKFHADKIMTRADIAKFLCIYYVGKDIDE